MNWSFGSLGSIVYSQSVSGGPVELDAVSIAVIRDRKEMGGLRPSVEFMFISL